MLVPINIQELFGNDVTISFGTDRTNVETSYGTYCKLLSKKHEPYLPKIKDVIFNYPATIVIWDDGTKTVVKCQADDVYNKEKGLMAAILKRLMGNDNTYNRVLKAWLH